MPKVTYVSMPGGFLCAAQNPCLSVVAVEGNGQADIGDELAVAEGLYPVVECTFAHCGNDIGDLCVACDENHGNDGTASVEVGLELRSAHSRPEDIEQQAAWLVAASR